MANTIERNTYSRLSYGNRASGENADDDDGLLYLCNVNETFLPLPDPNIFPAAIRVDSGGSIQNPQAVRDVTGVPIFPAGNEFLDLGGRAIENLGPQIDYYYFDDPSQDPNAQLDPVGISGSGGNFGTELNVAALRPYLEGGSVINQLPEDAINSLLYWADHCNEAGALARNVLRVNGLRQETECGQPLPAQRPGAPTTPAVSTPGTPAQGIRVYPNPARGELFLSLPESAGQGQAVFYNLQGKAVHYLPLSGGLNRLPLPSGLFKPGIYLLKARQGGASYQLKIAIH